MGKNIVLQLKEAFAILKDYPGIQDIIDIDMAKKFLESLESIADKIGDPLFTGLDPEAMEEIKRQVGSSFDDWENALQDLPKIMVAGDPDIKHGVLIEGWFPKDRAEAHSDFCDVSGYFKFKSDGSAKMSDGAELSEEGTWTEIYKKLAVFVQTKLAYPELPDNTDIKEKSE